MTPDNDIYNQDALRIQDVVAAVSHVNLKQTVRVIRALSLVAQAIGEVTLASHLNELLLQSTRQGSYYTPLHAKPENAASVACDKVLAGIVEDYGQVVIDSLCKLSSDPYYEAATSSTANDAERS